MAGEKWKLKMLELLELPGNETCADCGTSDPPPHFMSYDHGVFLCIDCVGLHRSLGTRYSKTKSVQLDNLDEAIYNEMRMKGNTKGKETYEYSVPDCWLKPSSASNIDIKEQWIRAKYERQEFINGARQEKFEYVNGAKYGWLWKKEKKGGKWNRRFFILSSLTGQMCYFHKKEDSDPKQKFCVKDVNISMVSEEIAQNHKHCMLISFPTQEDKPRQRHIFAYADTSYEIVDWFLNIRAARLNYLKPYLDGVARLSISKILSRDYLKMGYLHKTGGSKGDSWRKRFIFIDVNKFLYFTNPLDPLPLNEVRICLDESEGQYIHCVTEGVDGDYPKPPTNYCFMVTTFTNNKKRIFNFCAGTRDEMQQWISAFEEAMQVIDWLIPINNENKRMSLMSNISLTSMKSDSLSRSSTKSK